MCWKYLSLFKISFAVEDDDDCGDQKDSIWLE